MRNNCWPMTLRRNRHARFDQNDTFGLRVPREIGAMTGGIYAPVEDPTAHDEDARTAGAEIVQELTDNGFGLRYSALDPAGPSERPCPAGGVVAATPALCELSVLAPDCAPRRTAGSGHHRVRGLCAIAPAARTRARQRLARRSGR